METEREEVSTALNAINDCLKALHERLEGVEKYVQELPTPDKTYYRPEGKEDYLNLKENPTHLRTIRQHRDSWVAKLVRDSTQL